MLQDESQLYAKYGSNTPSVIGNCSSYLLTGTTDLRMAQTASQRFELTPNQIRRLSRSNFLLDVNGYLAKTERYDFHNHPNYIDGELDVKKKLIKLQV